MERTSNGMKPTAVYQAARDLMVRCHIDALPVNPYKIAVILKIPVISYSQAYRAGFRSSIETLRVTAKADAMCYKSPGNQYIIFYDEAQTPKERINFSLAHELGHIMLGHLNNEGILPRYEVNQKNEPKEKEADSFAGELLRPPILLILAGITRAQDISKSCNITLSAARSAYKSIQKISPYIYLSKTISTTMFYQTNFFKFINTHFCNTCHAIFTLERTMICPICGGTNIEHFSLIDDSRGDEECMHYKEYPVNEQGHLARCIRCDNEDIDPNDEYCMICGAPLVNICCGQMKDANQYDKYFDEDAGCGKTLPSNARFCTKCGGESTFYHKHILLSWKDEQQLEIK